MKRSSEQRFGFVVFLTAVVLVVLVVLANTVYASRWHLNKNGIWVRRGTPASMPVEAEQQQFLIREAQLALSVLKQNNVDSTAGPCLGPIFQGWVADLVHVPRTPDDLLAKNQCPSSVDGTPPRVLELQIDGSPVAVR